MRGFITLAVGKESYFELAANLLKSYKYHTKEAMKFAIVADKRNKYTEEFDDVIILNNPTCSYMDKIEILKLSPYDESIFIDSDCLAYGDLNVLWNYCSELEKNGGVTCFGKSLPKNSKDGWFTIDNIGDYKKCVSFIPQMHGGIIFLKKGCLQDKIYEDCVTISNSYSKYNFKYFDTPADEPILALSMAINGCPPIETLGEFIGEGIYLFYPTAEKVNTNIKKGKLEYKRGERLIRGSVLMHWQNLNTERPLYKTEVDRLNGFGKAFFPMHFVYYRIKLIRKK